MKTYLLLLLFVSYQAAYSQTEWRITGEAVPGGVAQLEPDPSAAGTFTCTERLSNRWFKLWDGTTSYVPLCGDSDPLGQTITLRTETDPDETGFRIRYVKKNDFFRLTLTESPSGIQLTVEQETPPKNLYLVGGPLNTHDPNWQLDDAAEMEADPENPFLFHYKGYLALNTFGDERGSIKFLLRRSWDPAYHPLGTSNVPLLQALKTPLGVRLGGSPDTKWTLPSNGTGNGYYELSLNTLEETLCVDSFRPSTEAYPARIFITGDAMPCGWENGQPEAMTPLADPYGAYTWTGNASPGEFKFLKARGTWGRCYAATTAREPVVFNQPHNIVYEEYLSGNGNDYKFTMSESGRYTITVDLTQTTMTVSQNNGTALKKRPETLDPVAVRYHRSTRRLHIDPTTSDAADAVVRIHSMSGTTLLWRSLGSGIAVSLPAGIYAVTASGSKISFGRKVVVH
jgi:hypothetical protein